MVIHILKDGTRPSDINGHVVRIKDAEPVYQLLNKINRERGKYARKNNNDN